MIIRSYYVIVVVDIDTHASVSSKGGSHGSKFRYVSEISKGRYWKIINQIFKYGS